MKPLLPVVHPNTTFTPEQYQKDLTTLTNTIGTIAGSVERVERALLGDSAFGYTGLVDRMAAVEKTLASKSTSSPPFDRKTVRKSLIYILTAVGAAAATYFSAKRDSSLSTPVSVNKSP